MRIKSRISRTSRYRGLIVAVAVVVVLLLLLIVLFGRGEVLEGETGSSNTQFTSDQITDQPNDQTDLALNDASDTSVSPIASPENPPATVQNPQQPTQSATSWPVQISMTDAASLTVVVNKKHQLPSQYTPAGLQDLSGGSLRSETATALRSLIGEAASNGYELSLLSGYRSYAKQKEVYNNYVAQYGQAEADTFSARPGHSEHQTGLAADIGNGICDLETCFGDTAAGKWVAVNAHRFGFIVRYPKGKEAETGYQYEPWHLRYIGADAAASVYTSGKTLDQYYGIPAGDYQ